MNDFDAEYKRLRTCPHCGKDITDLHDEIESKYAENVRLSD